MCYLDMMEVTCRHEQEGGGIEKRESGRRGGEREREIERERVKERHR